MFISDPKLRKSIGICEHHLHNPFEAEQLLNWLVNGDFSEADEFSAFHNSMSTRQIKSADHYYLNLKKSFDASERIYIEISSLKRYILKANEKNIECNHTSIEYLRKNNSNLIDQLETCVSSFDEFFVSLANIKEIVKHKQLIVVPHYSWKTDGKSISSRDLVRKYVFDSCQLLNIPIIDPDVCLLKLGNILTCIDSSHYTVKFEKLIALFYSKGYMNH